MNKKKTFNDWLSPAEENRGVPIGWQGKYLVTVHGGENWTEKSRWVRENITGIWRDSIRQPYYTVGFENKDQAVAFKLRWYE